MKSFKNLKIRTRLLLFRGIIILIYILLILFVVIQFTRINPILNQQIPQSLNQVQQSSKLDETAQFIRYYDEVLTQSARNYAFTGDQKWLDRYNENIPKLDDKINYAIDNGSQEDVKLFSDVDNSNQALIKMEVASQNAVKSGQKDQAVAILESAEYAQQKAIYAGALQKYAENRGAQYDDAIAASTTQINLATLQIHSVINQTIIIGLAIALILILVLILIGRYITISISRPIEILRLTIDKIAQGNLNQKIEVTSFDEIGSLALDFNTMVQAIKESRADIDKKVAEQTKDIAERESFVNEQRKAILNVLEDVEEEKNLTSKEKDKINTILHSIGDGVFVIDNQYKIILFNHIASEISGFSIKEALNNRYDKILKFIDEKTNKANDVFIKKSITSGQITSMANHTVLVRKDKTRVPVADSAAPLKDKTDKIIGCVVVFRDVTRERQIDQAKTDFVSVASHQLRTPLTAIKWYIEMLQTDKNHSLDEDQKGYVKEIYQGSQRLVTLVNDLLNIARIETGRLKIEPELISLPDFIHDIIKETEPLAKNKNCQIVYEKCKVSVPKILLDPTLIRQVFLNLITNAIHYSKNNSKILVSLKKEENKVILLVKDTGIGIPKPEQPKIFDRFFRASNASRQVATGTGLGLYISKLIVDNSGGKIWFESVENKGTTFFVSIPLKGMEQKKGEKTLEETPKE